MNESNPLFVSMFLSLSTMFLPTQVKELLSDNRRVELAYLANCAILSHQHPKQSWPSALGGDSQIADFIRLVVRSQERLADMKVDIPQIQGLCQELTEWHLGVQL